MTTTHPTPIETKSPVLGRPVPLALLFGLLLMRTVALLVGEAAAQAVFTAAGVADPLTAALWSTNVWIVAIDIATVAVVASVLKRQGSSWRSLFNKPRGKDLLLGLAAFVMLLFAFVVGNFTGNLVAYGGPPPTPTATGLQLPLWYGIWVVAVMPITVAVAEEVLYRGYLQPRFAARFGTLAGLVIVAVGFGIQHLAFELGDPQAMLARVINLTVVGLAMGAIFVWFKRLLPLIIGHWLIDVLLLGLPILLVIA